MTTWIRFDDIILNDRIAITHIHDHDLINLGLITDRHAFFDSAPEHKESVFLEAIKTLRPDLEGLQIYRISLSHERMQWKLWITATSLERVPMGTIPFEVDLMAQKYFEAQISQRGRELLSSLPVEAETCP
jgi:hypothetical protein